MRSFGIFIANLTLSPWQKLIRQAIQQLDNTMVNDHGQIYESE